MRVAWALMPAVSRLLSTLFCEKCGLTARPEQVERHTCLGNLFRNTLILLAMAISVRAEDQATRVFQEGQKAERAGDLLRAYMLYAQAAALDPTNLAIAAHRNQAGNLAVRTAVIHDVTTEPDPEAAFLLLMRSQGPGQVDQFGPAAMPTHLASPPGKKSFDLRGDAKMAPPILLIDRTSTPPRYSALFRLLRRNGRCVEVRSR